MMMAFTDGTDLSQLIHVFHESCHSYGDLCRQTYSLIGRNSEAGLILVSQQLNTENLDILDAFGWMAGLSSPDLIRLLTASNRSEEFTEKVWIKKLENEQAASGAAVTLLCWKDGRNKYLLAMDEGGETADGIQTAELTALLAMKIEALKSRAQRQPDEEKSEFRNGRLHNVGVLAAGVAHEVNNPLTGMINFAQMIQDHSDSDRIRRYADSVIREGNRIARIVRNLLSYSAFREEGPVLVNPADVLNDAISLLRSTLTSESISVDFAESVQLPAASLNSQQLEQVFINVLLNARDSLNRKFPGQHADKKIHIDLASRGDAPNQWAVFRLRDNGEGVPEEYLKKIFDEGFSTGDGSRNSGLGLPISRRIIQSSGGKLSLESEWGKGAMVTIEIPITGAK